MNTLPVARWSALLGYAGLIVSIVLWNTLITPLQGTALALTLGMMLLPLLFPLRGLLRGKPYTHAWTSFLALAYFLIGVWHAADTATRWYAMALVLSSLLLFIGCVFYARLGARRMRAEG